MCSNSVFGDEGAACTDPGELITKNDATRTAAAVAVFFALLIILPCRLAGIVEAPSIGKGCIRPLPLPLNRGLFSCISITDGYAVRPKDDPKRLDLFI